MLGPALRSAIAGALSAASGSVSLQSASCTGVCLEQTAVYPSSALINTLDATSVAGGTAAMPGGVALASVNLPDGVCSMTVTAKMTDLSGLVTSGSVNVTSALYSLMFEKVMGCPRGIARDSSLAVTFGAVLAGRGLDATASSSPKLFTCAPGALSTAVETKSAGIAAGSAGGLHLNPSETAGIALPSAIAIFTTLAYAYFYLYFKKREIKTKKDVDHKDHEHGDKTTTTTTLAALHEQAQSARAPGTFSMVNPLAAKESLALHEQSKSAQAHVFSIVNPSAAAKAHVFSIVNPLAAAKKSCFAFLAKNPASSSPGEDPQAARQVLLPLETTGFVAQPSASVFHEPQSPEVTSRSARGEWSAEAAATDVSVSVLDDQVEFTGVNLLYSSRAVTAAAEEAPTTFEGGVKPSLLSRASFGPGPASASALAAANISAAHYQPYQYQPVVESHGGVVAHTPLRRGEALSPSSFPPVILVANPMMVSPFNPTMTTAPFSAAAPFPTSQAIGGGGGSSLPGTPFSAAPLSTLADAPLSASLAYVSLPNPMYYHGTGDVGNKNNMLGAWRTIPLASSGVGGGPAIFPPNMIKPVFPPFRGGLNLHLPLKSVKTIAAVPMMPDYAPAPAIAPLPPVSTKTSRFLRQG